MKFLFVLVLLLGLGAVNFACNDSTVNPGDNQTLGNATGTEPEILSAPIGERICDGDDVVLSATCDGDPFPQHQWQINDGSGWSDMAGATTGTLTLSNVQLSESGNQYRIVCTNVHGVAMSSGASVIVDPGPVITLQPSDLTITTPQTTSAGMSVDVAGPRQHHSFQWQESPDNGITWSDMPGKTSRGLTFPTDMGTSGYLYRVVITNDCGTVTSSSARLTIN